MRLNISRNCDEQRYDDFYTAFSRPALQVLITSRATTKNTREKEGKKEGERKQARVVPLNLVSSVFFFFSIVEPGMRVFFSSFPFIRDC